MMKMKLVASRHRHLAATLPLCAASLFLTAPAYAQDQASDEMQSDAATQEQLVDDGFPSLDDLLHKIEEKEDGDDDVPTKVKTPKVQPRFLTTWGAKQSLRYKVNKETTIEGYLEQAIGSLDEPYKVPSSNWVAGLAGVYLGGGNSFTASMQVKQSYSDVFGTWDGSKDANFALGASRSIKLDKQWKLAPSVKLSKLTSDIKSRELQRYDLSLPLSYALNKTVTLKPITIAYNSQTYTSRPVDQTDRTTAFSTGVQYQSSAKSVFELTLSREERLSNQASAEYVRASITPKFDYKISSTSSIGLALSFEHRTSNSEDFVRWILAPKFQLKIDL